MESAYAQGARFLEIRLDYLAGDPRLQEIVKRHQGPLVATARRTQDGGQWRQSEEKRLQVLRRAIVEGFDYVDLEEDVADKIPRYGKTKRVISFHSFSGMPNDLWELYARLKDLDADVVKIAAMAHHVTDNFRMLELVRQADVPTIAVCMGPLGLPSRVLGAKFGSPFTFAAFNPLRTVAPGMLTFVDMRELYRYELINAATEVYGVIGDPIAQSLSPLAHNAAFAALGLNKVYVPFQVRVGELPLFITAMNDFGIQGLSVTIPHKQDILRYGEPADELVRQCKAANTLVRQDGQLRLYNTDGPAAIQAVLSALPPDPDTGLQSLADRAVLVLGAGGVARTIAQALVNHGAIVTIANRTEQRGTVLARAVGCNAIAWSQRHAKHFDIVINCTSVGMKPDSHISPFHQSALDEGMVVFDTVYNPEHTALVRNAIERECRVVTGVAMFVGQAQAQFKLFTGMDPPDGLMAQLVREELSPARNMLRQVRLETVQREARLME
jgi:3-dehydroquinate dehydratase/shikimate dehydrogenase